MQRGIQMSRLPQKEIISALDLAHDGFMIADSNSKILYFNKAYACLTRLEGMLKVGMFLRQLNQQGLVPSSSCLEISSRISPAPFLRYQGRASSRKSTLHSSGSLFHAA